MPRVDIDTVSPAVLRFSRSSETLGAYRRQSIFQTDAGARGTSAHIRKSSLGQVIQ
jgi:hypothetical protein